MTSGIYKQNYNIMFFFLKMEPTQDKFIIVDFIILLLISGFKSLSDKLGLRNMKNK